MPRINCNGRHKHPFLQAGSPQYANIYGWFINIYPLTQAPALILVDHVEESLDLLLLGPVAGVCHCHQCQCQCQCRWCLNQLFAFGFGRSPEHFCQPLLVTWDMTSWWNWLYQFCFKWLNLLWIRQNLRSCPQLYRSLRIFFPHFLQRCHRRLTLEEDISPCYSMNIENTFRKRMTSERLRLSLPSVSMLLNSSFNSWEVFDMAGQ